MKGHFKALHLPLAKLIDFATQLFKGPLEIWLVC